MKFSPRLLLQCVQNVTEYSVHLVEKTLLHRYDHFNMFSQIKLKIYLIIFNLKIYLLVSVVQKVKFKVC